MATGTLEATLSVPWSLLLTFELRSCSPPVLHNLKETGQEKSSIHLLSGTLSDLGLRLNEAVHFRDNSNSLLDKLLCWSWRTIRGQVAYSTLTACFQIRDIKVNVLLLLHATPREQKGRFLELLSILPRSESLLKSWSLPSKKNAWGRRCCGPCSVSSSNHTWYILTS